MNRYFVLEYVHILGAVLLVGYVLFWLIMAWALGRRVAGAGTLQLLRVVADSRWPPGPVPDTLRLRLAGLGWLFLLIMLGTGAALLWPHGLPVTEARAGGLFDGTIGMARFAKLALVGVLAAGHLGLTIRPTPGLAYVNAGVALGIVIVSALLH